MIALASASAICVRRLFGLRALIRMPFVSSCLPLLDFAGATIDAVTINHRTRFRIAAAFGIVDFAEDASHALRPASGGDAQRGNTPTPNLDACALPRRGLGGVGALFAVSRA